MADNIVCISRIDGGGAEDLIVNCPGTVELAISTADKEDIASKVYDVLSPELKIIMGLCQQNFRFSQQLYDTNGNLLTGVIKIFPTSTDCHNNTNPLKTFNVTATYTNNQLTDYRVAEA